MSKADEAKAHKAKSKFDNEEEDLMSEKVNLREREHEEAKLASVVAAGSVEEAEDQWIDEMARHAELLDRISKFCG